LKEIIYTDITHDSSGLNHDLLPQPYMSKPQLHLRSRVSLYFSCQVFFLWLV